MSDGMIAREGMTHFEDRGTTIADIRSYPEFQSLTRDLETYQRDHEQHIVKLTLGLLPKESRGTRNLRRCPPWRPHQLENELTDFP